MNHHPPGLREGDYLVKNPEQSIRCSTCASYNSWTGMCARYQWPVVTENVCNSWRPKGTRK